MSDNLNVDNRTMANHENNDKGSITQKVYQFANDSLRRAADAIFRATARLNNEISFTEILDALEDVGIGRDDKSDVATPAIQIPTPLADIAGVESMATTCSSMESTFQKSASNLSLDLNADSQGEDEIVNENQIEFGPKSLPIYSLDEVGDHFTLDDAWMVVYDKVYNFTHFLEMHPGGWDVMQEYLGYDGTVAFRGVGHSSKALKMMEPYLIGILPEEERIYTNRWQW